MLLGKCWLLLRRFAATIVGLLLVACTVSACDLPVPNVVDMALPDAIQKLENPDTETTRWSTTTE